MSRQFFPRLSQNYIEILEDEEHYDIIIEVGKDPNIKKLRGHTIILRNRSPFFQQNLASDKKYNDGVLTHIKLPNITPEVFQIILKYIYGGIILLNEKDILEIFNVLVAADQLLLKELVDYLQKYLIENEAEWMEQHFELTYRKSLHSKSLLEIQQFCTNCMAKSPEKIFKSLDFISLTENSLISLIRRDDLQMDEVEIWEHVLKWGLAQNATLALDPATWSDNDIKTMEITLQNFLPLIRFFGLSSKDFLRKVRPYRKLLSHQLYEDLLEYHLDPEIEIPNNIIFPRSGELCSKIININVVSLISTWIDNAKIKSRFANIKELYLPYEFKLLLRGSRDGFTPNQFHTLCDNIPRTVTFIKLKESEEIIGGYNPLIWKVSHGDGEWGKSKDSFIFSFKNKDNFKDPILSRVKKMDEALRYYVGCGPAFSIDLYLWVKEKDPSKEYNSSGCEQRSYEKKIRNTDNIFLMEDYEVFQIVKKEP